MSSLRYVISACGVRILVSAASLAANVDFGVITGLPGDDSRSRQMFGAAVLKLAFVRYRAKHRNNVSAI